MEAIIRDARIFGRQLGWFVGIWAASVAALFVVAQLIRLATHG